MDFAVRRRYIAINPCLSVERPSKRRRVKINALDHQQVQSLAGAMPDDQARLAVLMAAYMGLRSGELWALRRTTSTSCGASWSSTRRIKELTADQTKQLPDGYERLTPSLVIGPTKTHATRKLSIPSFLADELAAFMKADAPRRTPSSSRTATAGRSATRTSTSGPSSRWPAPSASTTSGTRAPRS